MNVNKEEQLFCKHMAELANSAYHKELRVYTDFLNLNEISIFHAMVHELPDIAYSLFGGMKDAERKRICFHGELLLDKGELLEDSMIYPSLYPIACIRISPVNLKFAGELTHRDYLGAILNLGIDRSKIGDIFLKERNAYVFCNESNCFFIVENLIKIKHTNVIAQQVEVENFQFSREYETITSTVSSVRLDSLIAVAFHSSRSSMLLFITGGKVFVNGRLILHPSYQLKENDIISVRGFGKFRYVGQTGTTKKGRIGISLLKYI